MKGKILIIAIMLCPLLVMGQSRSNLKGPKYKNYKVWKSDKQASTVHTLASVEKPKGPEAKNKRLFKKDNRSEALVVMEKDRSKRQGPWAKNYKPWKRDDQTEIDSSLAKE